MYNRIKRNTLKGTLLASACLFGIFFVGCQNNDNDIWDKDPIVRLEEKKVELKEKLVDTENGWFIDSFYPDGNANMLGSFAVWMKYNVDGTVLIKTDQDLKDLGAEKEEYNFVVLNSLALSFPHGNKIHAFTGVDASLARTDIEFIFDSYLDDGSIQFIGQMSKQKIIFKKATTEEADFNFENRWSLARKMYEVSKVTFSDNNKSTVFNFGYLTNEENESWEARSAQIYRQIGQGDYDFINTNSGIVTFRYLDDGITVVLKPAIETANGSKIEKLVLQGNSFLGVSEDSGSYVLFQ
jgi:hypothetical protein